MTGTPALRARCDSLLMFATMRRAARASLSPSSNSKSEIKSRIKSAVTLSSGAAPCNVAVRGMAMQRQDPSCGSSSVLHDGPHFLCVPTKVEHELQIDQRGERHDFVSGFCCEG